MHASARGASSARAGDRACGPLVILGRWGAHPEAERRGGHARRRELGDLPGDRGAQGQVRRRSDRCPHQGRPRAVRARPRISSASSSSRAASPAPRPRARSRRGSRRPRCATSSPRRSRRASSTGRRRSSTSSPTRRRSSFRPSKQASEKQARLVGKAGVPGRDQGRPRPGAGGAGRRGGGPDRSSKQFTQQAVQLGLDYGLQGPPSIQDPTFVRAVVFDNRFTEATPKSKFSAFFPSQESVAISVRLRPDLTDEERSDAIDLIRQATTEDVFQIRDASYLVSGPPVLADGLTDELSGQITILLIAALIVMALVLALVFAPPLRLLPLAVGLAGERDRLRSPRASRRLADDGGDRGPADPDRPRGRLRDPDPGALHRGAPSRLFARCARPPRPRRRVGPWWPRPGSPRRPASWS